MRFWYFLLLIVFGCKTPQPTTQTELATIQTQIENSPIFGQGFSGFALFDPTSEKYLYEFNSDKYFTPASNTKILTYFVASQILGDSVPAFRYLPKGDSLIIIGTGDPTLLNANFSDSARVLDICRNLSRSENREADKVFISTQNFDDDRYGAGWMWDDYPYAFQVHKSSLPIYGNVARFERTEDSPELKAIPFAFRQMIELDPSINNSRPRIIRTERGNVFKMNQSAYSGQLFGRNVPFDYSDSLMIRLFAEAIGKKVESIEVEDFSNFKTIYSTHSDSLFRRLMVNSDNHVAEQLLLLCSDKWLGKMNTRKLISAAMDSLLADVPQKPRWVDGSGVSRYNQITPQTLVFLLNKMYQSTPFREIQSIFPKGGENGTIKDWYGGTPTYVFAKTGTMTNVHCLSGYIETSSGKRLIFSFMHNNYAIPIRELKVEMQRILEWVRDTY